jgi:aryl-alcohol dehydrogenase-like predicted oxidoreductase
VESIVEIRTLGNSGIRVSVLGLGTVKLGRDQGLNYPHKFAIPDLKSARRLIDTASELGINLLDTAPAYGTSETRLGAVIIGQRRKWVLTTKVGETFRSGQSEHRFDPNFVRASIGRSLENLRTDYLDVVLIHSNGEDVAILTDSGALECLQDLKRRGIIRAIGISHKTLEGAERAIDLGCDVIMASLSLEAPEQQPVIARAAAQGCGVLVKKALASGRAGLDSLQFAASSAGVSSVVVGTIDPEHLAANAAALEHLKTD